MEFRGNSNFVPGLAQPATPAGAVRRWNTWRDLAVPYDGLSGIARQSGEERIGKEGKGNCAESRVSYATKSLDEATPAVKEAAKQKALADTRGSYSCFDDWHQCMQTKKTTNNEACKCVDMAVTVSIETWSQDYPMVDLAAPWGVPCTRTIYSGTVKLACLNANYGSGACTLLPPKVDPDDGR
jgi:hypothetical protein